jgi:hypothetical protein
VTLFKRRLTTETAKVAFKLLLGRFTRIDESKLVKLK